MALTAFQRHVCRLLAERLSSDVDVFHDTETALAATWERDRRVLEEQGFAVVTLRERPSFVEAEVSRRGGADRVLMQWIRDSAYRFFPLVAHDDLGLTLHPFDLATNKVLAMVGRVEVRDWVDVISCSEHLQPLGFLAWAACGKDPGFSPLSILEHAARSARYTAAEVAALHFDGPPPDAGDLSRRWQAMLAAAHETVAALPAQQAGKCVLGTNGELCTVQGSLLVDAVANGTLAFHEGSIRGALPQVVEGP